MPTQVINFNIPESKKHSVCYKTTEASPAITSIYIQRTHLPSPTPKSVKVTLEFPNEAPDKTYEAIPNEVA